MPLGVKDSSLAVIQIIMMQGAEGVAQQNFWKALTVSLPAANGCLLVSEARLMIIVSIHLLR